MLITGMNGCDCVVSTEEDALIQIIYRDNGVVDVIREKDSFISVYLQKCLIN